MKKHTTKFLISAVAVALVVGITTGALAASGSYYIEALLNKDITVEYNGKEQTFTDVNNKQVWPLTYDGTTYLPVRAVAKLFDTTVDWDGATNKVILGKTVSNGNYLIDVPSSDSTLACYWEYESGDTFKWKVSSSSSKTKSYEFDNSALKWENWAGDESDTDSKRMKFDVEGYNTLTFTVWASAPMTLYIHGDNGKVIKSYSLTKEQLKEDIEVNIKGVDEISFGFNERSDVGERTYAYIFDPVLSK